MQPSSSIASIVFVLIPYRGPSHARAYMESARLIAGCATNKVTATRREETAFQIMLARDHEMAVAWDRDVVPLLPDGWDHVDRWACPRLDTDPDYVIYIGEYGSNNADEFVLTVPAGVADLSGCRWVPQTSGKVDRNV